MSTLPSDLLKTAKALVIKVGSVLIRDAQSGAVRSDWFEALACDIAALVARGVRVAVVSSGGVALGRDALGIAYDVAPSKIPLAQKQAASAVGQYHMYHAYHQALSQYDLESAQVLLTLSETENRRMHLNARATLQALMDKQIVPIINENDSISTEEIRFGDNDRLAVRVAQMIGADGVILLSTIDGLYTDNPHDNPEARHIDYVDQITADHKAMAGEAVEGLSTGGMKSKIEAAINAVSSGTALVITDGQTLSPLSALEAGDKRATLFAPQGDKRGARKSFIGAHLKPAGEIVIDDGAVQALQKGRSLLPVGVVSVSGVFERGDVVSVHDRSGQKIAAGIAAYSALEAQKIVGKAAAELSLILGYSGRDELIHRNDLVLHKS